MRECADSQTHRIIHLQSCDDSFIGFYQRSDCVLVLYELRTHTDMIRRRSRTQGFVDEPGCNER